MATRREKMEKKIWTVFWRGGIYGSACHSDLTLNQARAMAKELQQTRDHWGIEIAHADGTVVEKF